MYNIEASITYVEQTAADSSTIYMVDIENFHIFLIKQFGVRACVISPSYLSRY